MYKTSASTHRSEILSTSNIGICAIDLKFCNFEIAQFDMDVVSSLLVNEDYHIS